MSETKQSALGAGWSWSLDLGGSWNLSSPSGHVIGVVRGKTWWVWDPEGNILEKASYTGSCDEGFVFVEDVVRRQELDKLDDLVVRFGGESRALRNYSSGWGWHPERNCDQERWFLRPPTVRGVSPTVRAAAVVTENGMFSVYSPFAPVSHHDKVESYLEPGWLLLLVAMGQAVDYLIESGWARVYDPLAPLMPPTTAVVTDDGFIELRVGILRVELTSRQVEDLMDPLTIALAELHEREVSDV